LTKKTQQYEAIRKERVKMVVPKRKKRGKGNGKEEAEDQTKSKH